MITKLSSLVKMAEAWNTCHTLVQPDGGKYLLMTSLAEKLADKRLIYFGESHEVPEVVDLELKVLKLLVEAANYGGANNRDSDLLNNKENVLLSLFCITKF